MVGVHSDVIGEKNKWRRMKMFVELLELWCAVYEVDLSFVWVFILCYD